MTTVMPFGDGRVVRHGIYVDRYIATLDKDISNLKERSVLPSSCKIELCFNIRPNSETKESEIFNPFLMAEKLLFEDISKSIR